MRLRSAAMAGVGVAIATSWVILVSCVGSDPDPASGSTSSSGATGDSGPTCDKVDLANDHVNCGTCGNVCANDEVCDQGKCGKTCTGRTRCEPSSGISFPRCIDVANDPQNCGACLNVCTVGGCGQGKCARRVFVTSTTTSAALTDGGTTTAAAADALCKSAASNAGLGGTWAAWISDDATSPKARFAENPAPYVLVDGTRVAANRDALFGGTLENAIRRTESKSPLNSEPVWTNTLPDGTKADAGPCDNWKSASATQPKVGIGNTDQANAGWTAAGDRSCADPAHLYCFEQ